MAKRRRGMMWLLVVLLLAGGVSTQVTRDIPAATLEARYATPPSQFVEAGGLRLHYRDQGQSQGPVFVLLHGSNSSLFTWERWVKVLADRFRVITLDLPGHGLTGPDAQQRYNPEGMAQVVEAFRAKLGVEKFHLAGNSMGGNVAWLYALQHPERVDRLVLVDPAGYPRAKGPPLIFKLAGMPVVGEVLSTITPRWIVERNLRQVYADPSKVTPALVQQFHDLLLRDGNRTATRERMRIAKDENAWRRMSELKAPTLILWGEKDPWIPVTDAERYDQDLPDSKVILYPDLGHTPMEEDPVRTANDAAAFLLEQRAEDGR